MPTKHLTFGGSTIARTLACPAWVHLSKDIPKSQGSNEFADRGTLLHNCMEEYLDRDGCVGFATMLEEGRSYNGIDLTKEMVDEALIPAYKAVEKLSALTGMGSDGYRLEPFVELITDEAGGSIDLLGWSADGETAIILDYKFGHFSVEVENNAQLMFYALCAAVDPATSSFIEDAKHLTLAIVQPNGEGETLNTWTVEMSALDQFELDVYEAIDRANAVTDETALDESCAGEHCKYCPAAPKCPRKTGAAMAALRLNALDLTTLNNSMLMVSELEAWCKDVKKLAHEQLEIGVNLPDFKLVAKRSSRVWTDEAALQKKIRSSKKMTVGETHEAPKLMSVAKLEKVLVKKGFDKSYLEAYYDSVSSGTTLAKADDKRAAVTLTPSTAALKALRDKL